MVIALVAADMAMRRPGSAMTIVPPLDTSESPVTTTYLLVSPAKVITSPARIVPVPAEASVIVVAPTA
jgi:hypothetical protein